MSVDSEEGKVYLLLTYEGEALTHTFAATTIEIAKDLADIIMDDNEEVDTVRMLPVTLDTLNQFQTIH